MPCGDKVATYNKELARKIIRLLESDHDGEVLSAVNKLREMARGQRQNLDEMLVAIYGSAAPKASPFTAWEAAETLRKAREAAETLRKAREAAKPKTHEYEQDGFKWNNPYKKASPHRFNAGRLIDLQNMFVEYGTDPLSVWEAEFVNDILDRQSDVLSDKQTEVIDKILAKYNNFAARNGDEKSFWGA